MSKPTVKDSLAKVEKMLAQVVGVQKVSLVSPHDFLKHAEREIQKAQGEPHAVSHVRLATLYKSVLYASAAIEDAESDSIKVPIYQCDQTTLDEQTNTLKTPEQAATLNPGSQSLFENGLMKQLAVLKQAADELSKLGAEPEPKEKAATTDMDEGDQEKEDKEEEKRAKAETAPAEAPPAPTAKRKVKKTDKVEWPDDLNDAHFVEKGTKSDPTWGRDTDRG